MFERFERLRNLWRKMVTPSQENSKSAELESRPLWRPNRKYASRREADRVYRERFKQKAETVSETPPVECVAPEIFLPASVESSSLTPQCIAVANGERNSNVEQSSFCFDAISALVKPGPAAKPRAQLAPPIIDAKPAPCEAPMLAETVNDPSPAMTPESEFPNWAEEARTDLPPRDSVEIARLEPFEDVARRAARMVNDSMRVQYQRLRRGFVPPDCQAAIIDPNAPVSGINFWGPR
jgi:hypothetical protein